MKFSTVAAIAVPLLLAYATYHYVGEGEEAVDPAACPRRPDGTLPGGTPDECFFSDSYLQARSRFRQLAAAAGAELSVYPVFEDLTTDVAVLRGRDPSRSLLHTSGVHGTEGYAGSAVQCAALNHYANSKTSPNVTIVFIHAVNPYGFHNDRRVNEDNIDLNRNFLTPAQFEMATARNANFAGYVDADIFLNPPVEQLSDSLLWNDIQQYKNMIAGIATLGYETMKKAMVSGNYAKPKGLSYGGFMQAKSTQNLIEIFRKESTDATVLIDVHTGLGPEGVDTLMLAKEVNLQQIESIFPTEYAQGRVVGAIKEHPGGSASSKAMSGYEETIGTTDALCSTFKADGLSQPLCVTQEFGTKMGIFVAKALVQENQAFWKGDEK
jgi:hypothetical protein